MFTIFVITVHLINLSQTLSKGLVPWKQHSWVEPPTKDLYSLVHQEIDLPTNLGLRLCKPRTHALRAPKTGASTGSQIGSGRYLVQTNRKFNWRLSNLEIDPKMCFQWFWSFGSDIYWLPLSSHSVCWSSRTSCHPFQEVPTGSVLTSPQSPNDQDQSLEFFWTEIIHWHHLDCLRCGQVPLELVNGQREFV